jgi:hypothetical protein
MPYNSVAYVREAGGPGELDKHVADIRGSGLTTVILIGLKLGWPDDDPKQKVGDIFYNAYPANLIVSGGKFNPNGTQAIHDWPAQVAQLKQQGRVSSVFLSFAGLRPYSADFEIIQALFMLGQIDALKQNIVALKEAFTFDGHCVIDGFDLDCEEGCIRQDTIVRFCRMAFDLGFRVTFCPYMNMTWWQGCMQTLWDGEDALDSHQREQPIPEDRRSPEDKPSHRDKLRDREKLGWWNLQCYSGGSGNLDDLQSWIGALASVVGKENAPSYLVPGLAPMGEDDVEGDVHCPSGENSFESIAAGWKNPKLAGMFLWRYDPLALAKNQDLCGGPNNLKGQNILKNYVKAINDGLSKG